jgi:hypothetical protein
VVADQRFTHAFREALWRAFGKVCFYCELPLDFAAMEIDHLIPESTAPDDLKSLKARLGLPDGFSVTGYENLAPACSNCNGRKRALALADGALMIKLAEIAARRPNLSQELERRRASRDLDAILRLIQNSIDDGKFSASDLARHLSFLELHPDGFYGSSGKDRTTPSPETRFTGMHFLDEGSVLLSASVEADLRRLGYGLHDLVHLLRGFGSMGRIAAKRLAGSEEPALYELRVDDKLRLVFTHESDGRILIISLFEKKAR